MNCCFCSPYSITYKFNSKKSQALTILLKKIIKLFFILQTVPAQRNNIVVISAFRK